MRSELKVLLNSDATYLVELINSVPNATARFIGGCVRDALLGIEIKDIDIATSLLPTQIVDLFQKQGFTIKPIGIEHGTVGVIYKSNMYEITTLREDISSNGRHAVVKFTDDYKIDAARRDFTVNALSVDAKGNIHDYFGGLEDLKQNIIKFIGNAEDRILEDYLRILRFFRFSSNIGNGKYDDMALKACRKYATNISSLSGERIYAEFSKILVTKDAPNCLKLMQDLGVLKEIIDINYNPKILQDLIHIETKYKLTDNFARHLAIILRSANITDTREIATRLKFSNKTKVMIDKFVRFDLYDEDLEFLNKLILFKYNQEFAENILPIIAIERNPKIMEYYGKFSAPILPVTPRDLMALGITGKNISATLQKLEQIFTSSKFTASKQDLLQTLGLT